MYELVPCDCGYGEGFYHTYAYGHHEYHPDVEPTEAGLALVQEKLPLASFYGHISCEYAYLHIKTTNKEMKFSL